MGQLATRKLVRVGDSVAVILPPGWLRFHGLRPGDKVQVRSNGRLVVTPQPELKGA